MPPIHEPHGHRAGLKPGQGHLLPVHDDAQNPVEQHDPERFQDQYHRRGQGHRPSCHHHPVHPLPPFAEPDAPLRTPDATGAPVTEGYRHRARYMGVPLLGKTLAEGKSWARVARGRVRPTARERSGGTPTDGVARKVSFAHS